MLLDLESGFQFEGIPELTTLNPQELLKSGNNAGFDDDVGFESQKYVMDIDEFIKTGDDEPYYLDIFDTDVLSSMIDTPLTSSGSFLDFDKGLFGLYGTETSENTLLETYAELEAGEVRNLQLTSKTQLLLVSEEKDDNSYMVKIKFQSLRNNYQQISLTRCTNDIGDCSIDKPENLSEYDKEEQNVSFDTHNETFGMRPLWKMKQDPRYQLPKGAQPKRDLSPYINKLHKLETLNNDKYYSRINIKELSQILELHDYHINLTRDLELSILKIFQTSCKFELGYKTWIRDTNKMERQDLINKLHSLTQHWYPELTKFKLEVIIRRGSYSIMQRRLRRERRMHRSSSYSS